jgi:putative nucleotidyltransferase with HDIG domain
MTYAGTFTVEQLIRTELPPLPGSVMRISAMLPDMNVSQHAIANAIKTDPVLAARILRLANSPIYALQRTVTNLTMAVSAVGNRAISESILISGIGDSFGLKILSSATGKAVWAHLLATGMAASDLCRLARLRGSEEAFSCGLLHDIGKLIFLRADTEFYLKVMARAQEEGDLIAVERDIFGFDHAELGALAAESWRLPGPVCEMIRYHHEPDLAKEAMAVTNVLAIADKLVNLKQAGMEVGEIVESKAAQNFGFSEIQLDYVWDSLEVRLREMMRVFG